MKKPPGFKKFYKKKEQIDKPEEESPEFSKPKKKRQRMSPNVAASNPKREDDELIS